jgi:CRP/FNR family transcriptional regulator, cyclic AMP receptor protein
VTVFQEAEMLHQVPFFAKVDMAKLKLVAFTSRAVRFAPGEALMVKNEPSDAAYVILEGEVEVMGETSAGEFVVLVIGTRSLVGEMSLLLDAPRVATVRAKGPVRALRIDGDVFLRLLSENPGCSLHVMRVLSSHLAKSTRQVERLTQKLQQAMPGDGDAVT